MTISIKEYAEAMGISTTAAYKRLNSERYSRYLVTDDHGRKRLDRAILDDQPGIQPDSTNSTLQVENSTTLSTTDSTNSTTQVETTTADSTDSTILSTILPEDSTIQVETSTTDSTGEVERLSTNSTTLSTSDRTDSTADAQAVILQIRLDYAQRDIERLEQQLDDMRQLVADMRGQLFAKDAQIGELSERLREAHVLTQNAQKRPRLPFTGWLDRLIGRRGKAAEGAAEGAGSSDR